MPLATYSERSGSQIDSQCLDREYLLVIGCSVVANMLFGHFQRGPQLYMISHDHRSSLMMPYLTALPRATGHCCFTILPLAFLFSLPGAAKKDSSKDPWQGTLP